MTALGYGIHRLSHQQACSCSQYVQRWHISATFPRGVYHKLRFWDLDDRSEPCVSVTGLLNRSLLDDIMYALHTSGGTMVL